MFEPESGIIGRRWTESMTLWGRESIDAGVCGFSEFGDRNRDSFQFGHARGTTQYRIGQRDGKPAV